MSAKTLLKDLGRHVARLAYQCDKDAACLEIISPEWVNQDIVHSPEHVTIVGRENLTALRDLLEEYLLLDV